MPSRSVPANPLPAKRGAAVSWPWTDRAGRLSLLKLAVFIGLFLPAVWILWQWWNGDLFPKVVTELIHRTGDWAARLLVLSLLVTPLRRIADWNRLILVRRMVGLAALAYALTHFGLYIVDQKFDLWRVGSEIALRIYLTIGFVALLGLSALGITSTDGMIRRLGGKRWNRLHSLVYAIAVLAILHYFMQSKIDATQATLLGGFLLYLLLWRIMQRLGIAGTAVSLTGLAVVAALATVAMEAAWYAFGTTAPWYRIMLANLTPQIMIRPAWVVLAAGLVLAVIGMVRQRPRQGTPAGRQNVAARA